MTFRPSSVPFLASRPSSDGRVVLFGAPLDLTESFRPGTAAAPDRIRFVSDVLETYSPALRRDLADLDLADAGDLSLPGGDLSAALRSIEQAVAGLPPRALPLMIGGEHTATLAAVTALRQRCPDLVVLQLDAHLDLRPSYDGQAVGHATWLYHAAQQTGLERVVQLGVRSGTREEYELSAACAWSSPDLDLPASARDLLQCHPVYLTIDIDVLDPSAAPGTGCPEPGGPSFSQLLDLLYSLDGLRVVGADVMEVLPAADLADITSMAAAKLVRELALLFARPD